MHIVKAVFVTTLLLIPLGVAPALSQTAARSPGMCKKDPAFRSQDFSIGNWNVYRDGVKKAEVSMELILNDCAIRETWLVSADKPTGNIDGLFGYSRALKSWLYAFTTDYANNYYWVGQVVKAGEIRYESKTRLPDGQFRMHRWTLSLQSDGHMQEKSVGSSDDGKTWTDEYVFVWIKKKS